MGRVKGQAGGDAESRDRKKKPEQIPTNAQIVDEAIQAFKKKLKGDLVKPTVGDLVRLLQLQKEIDADEPKEVKATWVEPNETESSEK